MNCPQCHASVTPQDKYCPGCGMALGAAKKASAKRPVKRDYEEASTQLVDVDEFREYMAKEGTEREPLASPKPPSNLARPANLAAGGPPPPVNLASPPPPVAGQPAPQAKVSMPVAPATPGAKPKVPAPAGAAANSDASDVLPQIKPAASQRVILLGLGLILTAVLIYVIYKLLAT